MKRKCIVSFSILLFLSCMGIPHASALIHVPYSTYTYSVTGEAQKSPHAYIPVASLSAAEGMETGLSSPSDIVTDKHDRLYIADTGNDRIVVLNSDLTLHGMIREFDNQGKTDSLDGPKGVFVTDTGVVYVSDTNHERILYFSEDLTLQGVIRKPESSLFEEDYEFKPQTLVVDKTGRLFVVSENMNKGILILDRDGNFKSFFGAQKVQYDPIELLWRSFMTEEQINRTESFVPSEYNSISMDEDGFLFVTSSSIDPTLQYAATVAKDTDDHYAPVKRFGTAGVDVLRRNGGYPPSGDVSVSLYEGGPSVIVDCVPGKFGTYTLLDSKRNKLFTYDNDGNLLYAFGGSGSQLGLFEGLCAGVTLSDNRVVCLDSINSELTVFSQTDYGALLYEVMELHDNHRYSEENAIWQQILLKNNNLDFAYIGMGNALIKNGEYEQAMELFRTASNKDLYSQAYQEYRKESLSRALLLIPVVLIALIVGVLWLFSAINRYNRQRIGKPGKKSLREQILYAFYVNFHPFDGYWDLHHEGNGSLKAGLVILAATCGAYIVRSVASGYLFTSDAAFWVQPLVLVLFLGLFVVSNWSITSLTNGKGTAAQMAATACYSVLPLLLTITPQILLSHFLSLSEASYMTMLNGVGYVWMAFSLFAGVLTTHQYSLGKAVATVLMTLLGMLIIVFLALMFFNLLEPMFAFFVSYYKEVVYRL